MVRKILYISMTIYLSACCTNKQTNISATIEKNIADSADTSVSFSKKSIINANKFWSETFSNLCRQSNKENICLSPLSAQFAMAMVANGAEGETKKEICKVLGSGIDYNNYYHELLQRLNTNKYCETTVANSVWINNKLKVKESFITSNKEYYDATIEITEFNENTLQRINDWCKENTKGKITSILDEIKPSDRMFLINALYFNAAWNKPFNKQNTTKADFTTESGKVVEVDMMKQRDNMPYLNDEQFEIVVKRYQGEYSMILVLPRNDTSCNVVACSLLQNLDKYLSEMNMCSVELSLPKFNTEYGTSLKPILERQGITRAFDGRAEFKGISKRPLCIDDIVQKSYIKVNEEGTEAAAVTAIRVGLTSMRQQNNIAVEFDRPFIYAIINNENSEVLFIGKIGNPIEK